MMAEGSEGSVLVIRVVPSIASGDVEKFKDEVNRAMGRNIITVPVEHIEKQQNSSQSVNFNADGYEQAQRAFGMDAVRSKSRKAISVLSRDTRDMEEGEDKENAKFMKQVSSGIQTGINKSVEIVQGTFDFVEKIYKYMRDASPLLQTIETLFSLAMTLFFMPLGNKLAEVLLPATLELVDKVVEIWDKFEGMTLSEMFSFAIMEGITILVGYFREIGDELAQNTGLLGSVGKLLQAIGVFIEGPAYTILELVMNMASFILTHIKEIISVLVGFFAAKIALDIATMWVIASSGTAAGLFGAGVAVAGVATAAGVGTYAGLSSLGMAEGGKVSATPGGQLRILAEAGEDEWVIPDSKLDSFGGNVYNIHINGYTDSELKAIIQEVVNEQISRSRLRGGF